MIALHFIPFFLVLGQVKIVFQRACRNLDADLVDPFAVELIRDLGIVQLELGGPQLGDILSPGQFRVAGVFLQMSGFITTITLTFHLGILDLNSLVNVVDRKKYLTIKI